MAGEPDPTSPREAATGSVPPPRHGARWTAAAGLLLLVTAGAAILAIPATARSLPGCALNKLTGLHCTGCGATRAARSLLSLDIAQAFAWNAAFVLALPLIAILAFNLVAQVLGRPQRIALRVPPAVSWGAVALLVAFTVLRNLHGEPFCYLAPHAIH